MRRTVRKSSAGCCLLTVSAAVVSGVMICRPLLASKSAMSSRNLGAHCMITSSGRSKQNLMLRREVLTMLLKTIPMQTILQSLQTAERSLDITDTTGTMFESTDVYIALYRYVTYDYACRTAQSIGDFTAVWDSYIRLRLPDIRRMYDALYAQYDPISNYDMTERAADGTAKGKTTDKTTPHGSTTQTSTVTGSEMVTYNRQGADSSSFQPYDQTVTQAGATPRTTTDTTTYGAGTYSDTEHTVTNDQTATVDGVTVTGNEVKEHILTRSGNIGVTTTQQMIESELKLRGFQLLSTIVRDFITENCFVSWGVGDN